MAKHRPTPEELYEAKYTIYALEAVNGGPVRRDLGRSWLLGVAVLALVAVFSLASCFHG